MASAFDERIVAAVSHCGCVNYADSMGREAGIQIEFCVPSIVEAFDIEDVVTLVAPRALLLSATTDDKWSRGAQAMYDYSKGVFPDGHLRLNLWDAGHVFTTRCVGLPMPSSRSIFGWPLHLDVSLFRGVETYWD